MEIIPLPALSDNYIYLLHDPKSDWCGVVDPAVADVPLSAAAQRGWKISTILNTHHHGDHVGGNMEIVQATGADVVGPGKDRARIPGLTHPVSEGDKLQFGTYPFEVLETDGHTIGHIVYFQPVEKALFSGDTLFILGCGRLFEGSPAQMWESLKKIRSLPPETLFYCGHEYSASNAAFARSVDPDNQALAKKADEIAAARARSRPTIPGRLSEETATNPFLRADDPAFAEKLGLAGQPPEKIFTALRQQKDSF